MNIRSHIPNSITCCNLVSGCVSIVMAFSSCYYGALGFILLAALFDFFDGFSARALRVSSPIGKELDSLADDITFGVAPAAMLFVYLRAATGWIVLPYVVFLMAAFSALRLAKFNLDERQTSSFIGLATPANAIFWASLVPIMHQVYAHISTLTAGILIALVLLCCYLLVAEIPFFSLKFHNLKWKDNRSRFIFLIGDVLLLLAGGVVGCIKHDVCFCLTGALCLIMLWYMSLNLLSRNK